MDAGLLTYAKNEADIRRGRTQGRINVGTAIISAKTEMFRIDIDDEECIHHLKVGNCKLTINGLLMQDIFPQPNFYHPY